MSAEVVALIAAAVAVFSAVLAVRATALVARTVLANHEGRSREAVAASTLTVRVVEGHTRRDIATDTRDYVFVVALANSSIQERRFDGVTLRVTYRTRANFIGAVDLESSDPITVPAGQPVNASLRFTTSNIIPRHCRVDAYALSFFEAGGNRTTVDASLPAVLQADTDGTGPATWGWD